MTMLHYLLLFLHLLLVTDAGDADLKPIFVVKPRNVELACVLAAFTTELTFPSAMKLKNQELTWKLLRGSTCEELKLTSTNEGVPYTLTIGLNKKEPNKTFEANPITLTYTEKRKSHEYLNTDNNFATSGEKRYQCKSKNVVKVKGDDGGKISIAFKGLSIQMFNITTNDNFTGKFSSCIRDKVTSNKTAIAVSVTLLLLIVIAIIVFVVFNRRRHSRSG